MALEDVSVYVETTVGSPVENVYVGLHNSSTKAKITSDYSDATGLVTFPAVESSTNSGVYEIRIAPPFPTSITNGTVQNITVLAEPAAPLQNAFTIKVTLESLPVATNPTLCRCSGYFSDMSGAALNGVSLHFTEKDLPQLQYISSASDYETKVIIPSRKVVKTEKNPSSGKAGYASVDLYRGGEYMLTMEGFQNAPRTVQIPDLSAANLSDVIFPVVSTVEYLDGDVPVAPTSSPEVSFGVDATKELTFGVLLRSGVTADPGEVSFIAEDDTIVELTANHADKTLTLKGLLVGQTTITVSRSLDEGVKISPVPTLIGNLLVTVNG